MLKKEFINNQNKSLIEVLQQSAELNFNAIKSLMRKGDVRVDNKKVKENIVLQGGETITYFINQKMPEIIYQDQNLLIVNKPRKMQTVNYNGNDLTSLLKQNYEFCQPCHRLDTNTSGINVFALNQYAYDEILNAFKNNQVEKKYIAFVSGQPKQHDIIKSYLVKDAINSTVKIYNQKVKSSSEIITEYQLIKNLDNNLSLLEVTLHTGKTHQIRAHLSHIGLPILGDRKYGNSQMNKLYKKNNQCLISYSIKFDFSNQSGLYYLSNTLFKLNENKEEIIKIGEDLC